MRKLMLVLTTAMTFSMSLNAQVKKDINVYSVTGNYLIQSASFDAYSIIMASAGTSLVYLNQSRGTSKYVLYAGVGCYFASFACRFISINRKREAGLTLNEYGIGLKIPLSK